MSKELAIGIDFGGTSIKAGVVLDDEVVYTAEPIKTGSDAGPEKMIPKMISLVQELRGMFPEIRSVGVGIPGFVDSDTGLVHEMPNVNGWTKIPLREELAKSIDLPIAVENDANAMAYAEWKRGAGKGMKHLVAITIGTGVGGGIILNGQLHRGARSVAGEIGMSSIDYRGRVGDFGNRGMLEAYIGHREIAEDARKVFKEAGREPMADLVKLSEAALGGDELALQVWDDVAAKLSCSLMTICYLLNPEAIVIGGGVAKAGALLFEPLEKHLHAQLIPVLRDHIQILPARFGNSAGTIGSAVLGLELAGLSEI